jgi:hypothetical protein
VVVGCTQEGCAVRPRARRRDDALLVIEEPSLGKMHLALDPPARASTPELLFTENETNAKRVFGAENTSPHVKDAFHDYVIGGKKDAVSPNGHGSKAAWHVRFDVEPGGSRTLNLRLYSAAITPKRVFGAAFARIFDERKREHDAYYDAKEPVKLAPEERLVVRQAYAGLLWTKQFYHYSVDAWLEGDPDQPAPPPEHKTGRNRDWRHLYNRDVLSMPDKWEYPWFAAWDLAFHMLPMARIDPEFAKQQLLLLLREWYMHPNGQIPAYEFNFSDVNPPVHAWACWRVYKLTGARGARDRDFLARAFQKLLINFTWWVNRKDPFGNHLFAGGFLGLDNIGIFDRSRPLPGGGQLIQSDGTAWMAFYCSTMLSMAIELARGDPVYEDVASKFFEHFVAICDSMNRLGRERTVEREDGLLLRPDGQSRASRSRCACARWSDWCRCFAAEVVAFRRHRALCPKLRHRIEWFLRHRTDPQGDDLVPRIRRAERPRPALAIPSRERLIRVLRLRARRERVPVAARSALALAHPQG